MNALRALFWLWCIKPSHLKRWTTKEWWAATYECAPEELLLAKIFRSKWTIPLYWIVTKLPKPPV